MTTQENKTDAIISEDITEITSFREMNLPESILHKLAHLGLERPTPIQVQAIPAALAGKDIIGSAQTGTGKTAAFGIPLIIHLLNNKNDKALVITPTRELATQVMSKISELLSSTSKIKTTTLIGGEPINKQLNQLRVNPRLIVGTPGRISDHIKRKSLNLDNVTYLVLDETDRMLDMGFSIQIDEIVQHIPGNKQTLLFSATLPNKIISVAKKYMAEPIRIAIGQHSKPAEKVKQSIIRLTESAKHNTLMEELDKRSGTVIIFTKTKMGADKLATKLQKERHRAEAIHGDLRHGKREKIIREFRDQKFNILVATDVAARGLDIPHIEHVINYDLPQDAEDYIHRIGRTARAEAEGEALSFITDSDIIKWRIIERISGINLLPSSDDAKGRGKGDRNGRSNRSDSRSNSKGGRSFKSGGFKQGNDRQDEERSSGKSFGSKKPFSKSGESKGKKDFRNKDSKAEGGNTKFSKKKFGSKSKNV